MQTQHYRPRDIRVRYLGQMAVRAARLSGADAMTTALRRIDAEFGHAAIINDLKLSVERAILAGPNHPAIKARYKIVARLVGSTGLAMAILILRHKQREYRGWQSETLREAMLICRWLRFTKRDVWFSSIVQDLLTA